MKEVKLNHRVGDIQVKVCMEMWEAWHLRTVMGRRIGLLGVDEGRGTPFRQSGAAETSSEQRQ